MITSLVWSYYTHLPHLVLNTPLFFFFLIPFSSPLSVFWCPSLLQKTCLPVSSLLLPVAPVTPTQCLNLPLSSHSYGFLSPTAPYLPPQPCGCHSALCFHKCGFLGFSCVCLILASLILSRCICVVKNDKISFSFTRAPEYPILYLYHICFIHWGSLGFVSSFGNCDQSCGEHSSTHVSVTR